MKRGGRLDELLNLLFMILAIGAIVCYFALNGDNPTYLILGGIAVLLRVAHYIMRFF
ncbi:MAG: hypothetical protein LBG28_12150 [Tannerella sp.]|nr:hypothetical protein [Tannerella sp.]